MIGVKNDLNPVWIRDGEERVEAMTIQVSVQNQKIRIINAYGPQEYDIDNKKLHFRNSSFHNLTYVSSVSINPHHFTVK